MLPRLLGHGTWVTSGHHMSFVHSCTASPHNIKCCTCGYVGAATLAIPLFFSTYYVGLSVLGSSHNTHKNLSAAATYIATYFIYITTSLVQTESFGHDWIWEAARLPGREIGIAS